MKHIFSITIVLGFLAALVFYNMNDATPTPKSKSEDDAANELPYIVSTTSQIGDIVLNITKDEAKSESLMGVGIDPHLYHPTRSDVEKMLRADMLFYNGMNLEGKMEDFLEKLSSEKDALSVAEGLPEDRIQNLEQDGAYDPHIWMDVRNWIIASENITKQLAEKFPDLKDSIESRSLTYLEELRALDAYIKETIATIPEDKRVLVTAHDAFGYYGRAYGLEVLGIQGISTESEASIAQVQKLVELIVEREIPAVFIESSVSTQNINAVIEGAKAKGHELHIGDTLYSDAMGEAGTSQGTYIGMMAHNTYAIAQALGGSPEPYSVEDEVNND